MVSLSWVISKADVAHAGAQGGIRVHRPPPIDPLAEARDALAKDATVRAARCKAMIDAALKETRCSLVSRLETLDAGGGAITVRPSAPFLVPE